MYNKISDNGGQTRQLFDAETPFTKIFTPLMLQLTVTVDGNSLVERHQFNVRAKNGEPAKQIVDHAMYTVENGKLVQVGDY